MCGFVGYVSSNGYSGGARKALELIKHRGPDNTGFYDYEESDCKLTLGHVRLSIIDLHIGANQPFTSECGDYAMVFNGEIYNFEKLRSSYLDGAGLKTSSDTEVLLNLYIKYGSKLLNQLEGMFSFAVFDKKNELLFLARDQLGIKPLYYYHDDEILAFSSEIKSLFAFDGIKKKIDEYAMYEFMLNSFVYEPHTGFEDVYKLRAGEFILYSCKEKKIIEQVNYWKPDDPILNMKYSIEDKVCSDLEREVKCSVKQHTLSDVPLCLFFSGGVDSSLILSELDETTALVVKSDAKESAKAGFVDDYIYSKDIAKIFNKDIEEIEIEAIKSKEAFLEAVNNSSILSEELLADLTLISTLNISNKARELGYKVALSGMGADELFAGYEKYKLIQYRHLYFLAYPFARIFSKIPSFSKKAERFLGFCQAKELVWQYTAVLGYFGKIDVSEFYCQFRDDFEERYFNKLNQKIDNIKGTPLKKILYLDIFGFLSHNFLVADKASMKASLEVRVPLATKKLFELAFNTDVKNLISFGSTKKPLRKMLYKVLPKSLVNRRKTGFHPPMDGILSEFSCDELVSVFDENQLFDLMCRDYVWKILNEHVSKKKNHTLKLFQMLYLSYWYKNNFIGHIEEEN